MAEQSMFDITWARQDQWGGEWHGLGGRFGVAQQFMCKLLDETQVAPVEDTALFECLAWLTDQLLWWMDNKRPTDDAEQLTQWEQEQEKLTQFIRKIREIDDRPVDPDLLKQLESWIQLANIDQQSRERFHNTSKLFHRLRTTNFDYVQLQHLSSLFQAQAKLALAYHGLFGNGDLKRLEPDPNAPLIYVNADLMTKCATDYRLAQQALHQRQRMPYENGEAWITWESHVLYLADLMAYECLKPLKSAGILPQDTAVVTYLQQATEIRLLPYYNIMLIALPSWVQNLYDQPSSAFLVIPHEVGHSLYRFGKLGSEAQKVHEKLDEGLKDMGIPVADWRSRWMEELFADAFGCLMAGPASILGIQEYLATGAPEHFMEPSPDHPIAAIRPLIQTEMLRIIDERGIKPYKSAPQLLDQHWQIFLTNDGGTRLQSDNVKNVHFDLLGQEATLSGQTILNQVRPVLLLIFDLFDELFPAEQSPKHWNAWSSDIANDGRPVAANLEKLQKQYQQFYQNDDVLNIEPPSVNADYQPSPLHEKITEIAGKIARGAPDTTVPISEWSQIFNIAGWTDEGGKAGHLP